MGENSFFARCYVKPESGQPLLKVRVSISDPFLPAMETRPDFFNRIGQFLPSTNGSYGGCSQSISETSANAVGPSINAKLAVAHSPPDQQSGEPIVIPSSLRMILEVVSQKPAHMLKLPGPGIVSLPSLLNGRLHGSGLP